jgi:dipeptidyl aminopeptidase/acylaminoacyl peptidase
LSFFTPSPVFAAVTPTLRRLPLSLLLLSGLSLAQEPYQKPPKEVADVLHAPLPPALFFSPSRADLLLGTTVRYPPVAELAQPFMRLGGVRVIAKNRALHSATYWSGLSLVNVATGASRVIAMPAGAKLGVPRWNADGSRIAVTNTTPSAVELWLVDAKSARARRVEGMRLNPMLGGELQWLADQKTLLVKQVPAGQGAPPPADAHRPQHPGVLRPDQGQQHLRGARRAQEPS